MKYLSLVCLIFALWCLSAANAKKDKVRLEKVSTLTLNADQWTSGRRSSPIKQLQCVGGYCSRAKVTSAQCYNRGFDGRDVQWECKAEMPANYKFGKVEVICEGYDYPEDEYILVGSCGLEYTIDEVAGGGGGGGSNHYSNNHYYAAKNHIKDNGFSYFPVLVIIGLIALIYFTCLREPNAQGARHSSSTTNDDYPSAPPQPPPAGFRSEYFGGDSGASCSGSASSSSYGPRTQTRSSGPGFFSGMAAGGLMGYLFGSSRSNTYANRPYASSYSSWGTPSTSSGYSSGFSSGGGGGSSGSETRTSSGFGSTRRR
ncbi:Store-operated calcium entry-associated regulatory factor [Tyrophagus putrescentiae]|nr:Store-operated calcium entry-associated regulatory factor [Tyrophagus putrescentiae]